MEDKRATVEARLREREAQRQAGLQSGREEKAAAADPEERAEVFFAAFNAESKGLERQLREARELRGEGEEALARCFDGLSAQLQGLQDRLNSATRFLPGYDIRQRQKSIDALSLRLATDRSRLLPKKRFRFKCRTKLTKAPAAGASEAAPETPSVPTLEAQDGFCDRDRELLVLEQAELRGKDLALTRLRNCTVLLRGSPGALHINGLHNCRVCIGPVARSLFVSDCSDCEFAIACQQLRVHTSMRVDFYLHVTSRAIIEDCSALRFAPYRWQYPGIQDHFQETKLPLDVNRWDDVDDFKWLRRDEASPNWAVLPEPDRRADWGEDTPAAPAPS